MLRTAHQVVAVALSVAIVALACGRLGFDGRRDGGVTSQLDGGSGDAPVDPGDAPFSGSATDGSPFGDGAGSAAICPYMNCPPNENTCCVGTMLPVCAPAGTCPGVETECDLDNPLCGGGPAQMCCPTPDGGAFCTPALCIM